MPIRLRLTLLFTLGAMVLLVGFGAFVHARLGQDLLDGVDLGLRARAADLTAQLQSGATPSLESAGQLVDADESLTQLLDSAGSVLASSGQGRASALLAALDLGSVSRLSFFTRTLASIDTDPLRVLAVPIELAPGQRFLVLGATLGDRQDALEGLRTALLIAGPLAALLMGVAAWFVIGGALGPVERMRAEAAAISASEPERRLSGGRGRDELARLAATLNAMLARLQAATERERRLLGDASHELRTPLSVLKMELDLALVRERTHEELVATLRAAADETDRLARLAEDLLVEAAARGGRLPMRREPIILSELVAAAASGHAQRAEASGARIQVEAAPVTVSVDPARIRQALENLLANAVRHAPVGGVIRLAATVHSGQLQIVVADEGPGLADPTAAFEPDQQAGRGLAIVRAIAEAHGGTASARNPPVGGAEITVTIPAR